MEFISIIFSLFELLFHPGSISSGIANFYRTNGKKAANVNFNRCFAAFSPGLAGWGK